MQTDSFSHARVRMLGNKRFLAILSITIILLLTITNNSLLTLPVASVSIQDNFPNSSNGAYTILFFRYLEDGEPILLSSSTIKAGQSVSLYDSFLSSRQSDPYVHYSVLVLQELPNGSIAEILNYHWTAIVKEDATGLGNAVSSTERIVLTRLHDDSSTNVQVNGMIIPYQKELIITESDRYSSFATHVNTKLEERAQNTLSTAWPINGLSEIGTISQAENSEPSSFASTSTKLAHAEGGFWKWVNIKLWNGVWTIVGEGSAIGNMTDVFSFGNYSGIELDVVTSVNGGAWSISGSWMLNASGVIISYPPLHCCGNYYAKTGINFEEDQLEFCGLVTCRLLDVYQIHPIGWNGGASGWTDAGSSTSLPGSGLSPDLIEKLGLSCLAFPAGEQFVLAPGNGYRYNNATMLNGVKGAPDNVTIGDVTFYEHHSLHHFTFGNEYPFYYLYTSSIYSDPSQWPVVFTSYGTSPDC